MAAIRRFSLLFLYFFLVFPAVVSLESFFCPPVQFCPVCVERKHCVVLWIEPFIKCGSIKKKYLKKQKRNNKHFLWEKLQRAEALSLLNLMAQMRNLLWHSFAAKLKKQQCHQTWHLIDNCLMWHWNSNLALKNNRFDIIMTWLTFETTYYTFNKMNIPSKLIYAVLS